MNSSKNILFISYDGMTDPLGQGQVIPYLKGLTKYGFKFTILSCDKPDRFLQHKNQVELLLKDHPIKWVAIPYHKKPPVLSSMYDVAMLRRKAVRLHAEECFHMVHTRAGIPALLGLWMKRKFGIKFLHDIREFYADSRVDGGMWNTSNFFYKRIYKFFKRKEEQELADSDGIVCLTYAAEKIVKASAGYKKSIPVEVIPCSVDMALFDPGKIDLDKTNQLKKKLGITGKDVVITYLGSLGGWYLTDEMMKFCKMVSSRIVDVKFLFITPHEHETVLDAAGKFQIPTERIIVTHAQRNDVPILLSLSNYAVFFIKACYSKQSSSPTKHGEIMAMGIPVITNSGVGDVAKIVEKYHAGIVLDSFDDDHLGNAADEIAKSIGSGRFNPIAIRAAAREYYNLENAVEKYKKIYDLVLNS